jgi:uncharacterized membrane protein YhaH (DUF805 family)
MGFVEAATTVYIRKYAQFSGTASRSEYWYSVLFSVVFSIALQFIGAAMHSHVLSFLYSVASLLPSLAVTIRRLHDVGKSGWWYCLAFTIVGAFVLLFWFCQKGYVAGNKYANDSRRLGEVFA